MDSDLSNGYCYLPFEQMGPDHYLADEVVNNNNFIIILPKKQREKEMCAAFCRHIIIIFPFSSNLERENASVCLNFFLEAVLSLIIIIIEEQVEYKEHRH